MCYGEGTEDVDSFGKDAPVIFERNSSFFFEELFQDAHVQFTFLEEHFRSKGFAWRQR